ncbi:MAG TPA: cupredoxin domain-containing protein, partial [Thermoanaerobaculia bacterium]|nr:cupredoxin domain-containing protein [Thermoanaerobaculia bacterium]
NYCEGKVLDKLSVHYNIGHLMTMEGDSTKPGGKYLVALNKLAIDRFVPVGPLHPQNHQLIDISNDKMQLLYDMPLPLGEPHYAQMIKADKLHPIEVYPKEENHHPLAVWDVKDAGVTRQGDKVIAKVVAVRSTLWPTSINVQKGDTVTVAITNIEQTTDELHGFGLLDYNINVVVDPGETKTFTFKADKEGVFPYYCTNFCSALHQEMQGYLIVNVR